MRRSLRIRVQVARRRRGFRAGELVCNQFQTVRRQRVLGADGVPERRIADQLIVIHRLIVA